MNLQYISNSNGETAGVFIPIEEWNALKEKYKGIENEEIPMPEWHKAIVEERLTEYRNNPDSALDFDSAIDEIENEL